MASTVVKPSWTQDNELFYAKHNFFCYFRDRVGCWGSQHQAVHCRILKQYTHIQWIDNHKNWSQEVPQWSFWRQPRLLQWNRVLLYRVSWNYHLNQQKLGISLRTPLHLVESTAERSLYTSDSAERISTAGHNRCWSQISLPAWW